MASDPKELAEDIKKALGKDKEETSKENKGFAEAIIEAIQLNAIVIIPTGGVNGTAPSSGGPLVDGKAVNGKILGLAGPAIAQIMQLKMGFPSVSAQLLGLANAIAAHMLSNANVVFDPGGIVGVCSNTPTSPGVLTGAGSKGRITGMVPKGLAAAMASSMGGPPTKELEGTAKAIINHLQSKTEISFASASVVAVCSAGGGPIAAGFAAGGRVL